MCWTLRSQAVFRSAEQEHQGRNFAAKPISRAAERTWSGTRSCIERQHDTEVTPLTETGGTISISSGAPVGSMQISIWQRQLWFPQQRRDWELQRHWGSQRLVQKEIILNEEPPPAQYLSSSAFCLLASDNIHDDIIRISWLGNMFNRLLSHTSTQL